MNGVAPLFIRLLTNSITTYATLLSYILNIQHPVQSGFYLKRLYWRTKIDIFVIVNVLENSLCGKDRIRTYCVSYVLDLQSSAHPPSEQLSL